jgi:hypothetical protein
MRSTKPERPSAGDDGGVTTHHDGTNGKPSQRLACTAPFGQYCQEMFRLTRQERRLLAFILAAFLAGLGLKHWRESREVEAAVAAVRPD